MSQKVLILTTYHNYLRSEVDSYSQEDSSLFIPEKAIGMTPAPHEYDLCRAKTVLEALSEGWKLLAPPHSFKVYPGTEDEDVMWEWWLIKE